MIVAMLRLRLAPEHKNSFVSALKVVCAHAEATPGCLESSLYLAAEDDDVLLYFELWAFDEDLKRHLRTENYRKLLFLMELSADVPEPNSYDIVAQGGMEIVKEARQPEMGVS